MKHFYALIPEQPMNRILNDLVDVVQQPLTDIRVPGFLYDNSKGPVYYYDFSRVYIEFGNTYLEIRRVEDENGDSHLKASITYAVLFEVKQDGDDIIEASTSIMELILPESWDYSVSHVNCRYNNDMSIIDGSMSSIALDISHGNKLFPQRLSTSRLLLHSMTTHGVGIVSDQNILAWENLRKPNAQDFSIYEWSRTAI